LYHILKTQEYKGIIKSSIVIGAIIGFIIGILSTVHVIIIFLGILSGIVFVLIGGLIAVGVKKVYKRHNS
jgi:galactitol-specific phosphotransferase system IIC component